MSPVHFFSRRWLSRMSPAFSISCRSSCSWQTQPTWPMWSLCSHGRVYVYQYHSCLTLNKAMLIQTLHTLALCW